MELQRPLYWHQGLFLQPQHFQLADRVNQSLLIPLLEYMTPHFWGVFDISIHKAALGARSFQLSRGEFVFQDGSHLVTPGNAVVESRIFEEDWVAGGKPFTIYIGLKKWVEAGENVTVVDSMDALSKVSTRYAVTNDPENAPDIHSTGPTGEVRRMSFVLKVFWETEINQIGDYLLIPVAQLERTREGIEFSQKFIPPSISIGSSLLLFENIKEIRDQLSSRSRQLEGYKRQRGIQTSDFGTRDMVYLLALRTLNRFLPLLFHFYESRQQVHPWQAYGVLRQMIGELSTFSESINAQGESMQDGSQLLPEYDHQNLGECFFSAHLLITKLLDEIVSGPEYVLPLLYDGTYFTSEMKPLHFEQKHRYFIALKSGDESSSFLQSVSTVVKLGSRERLPLLIARALPGIGLEFLQTPPQELPRRANTFYFAIDGNGEQWGFVEKGRNIALYWDNAPEDLEVELMIVARG
jgi:type VI secretion system protein ImpJ